MDMIRDGSLSGRAVFLDILDAFDAVNFADEFFSEIHEFADRFPFF